MKTLLCFDINVRNQLGQGESKTRFRTTETRPWVESVTRNFGIHIDL